MSTTPSRKLEPTSYDAQPQQRDAVLIVAHGDGWLEAYAERHVDVMLVQPPYVLGIAGERLADEWLDATLPRRYADLRWPILRRAAERLRAVRPSDILRRQLDLDLLRALDRHANHERERLVWTL